MAKACSWVGPGWRAPSPMGITSMKRTSTGWPLGKDSHGGSRPSQPGSSTQLSLVLRPAATQAERPSSTGGSKSKPVMARNPAGVGSSRLMFTPSRPIALRAGTRGASSTPLVVRVTCSTPGQGFQPAEEVQAPPAHQGLAPGDLEPGDAQLHRRLGHLQKLLEGEQVLVAAQGHPLGHAVLAAQVAPVGDGEADVVDVAVKPVSHGVSSKTRSPLLPPCFSSRRMSESTIRLSTALHMS